MKKIHYLLVIIAVLYVLAFNTYDMAHYQLQLAGIIALGGYGTFDLTSVSHMFANLGDTVPFQNSVYALKAPGLFVLGAMDYFILQLMGLDYATHPKFITYYFQLGFAVLPMLFVLYFWYEVFRKEKNVSETQAILLIALLGLGTMLFSYSGVISHDVWALVCLSWAWYGWKTGYGFARIVFLLGMAPVFSYKATVIAIGFLLYFINRSRDWKLIGWFLVGVLPLFLYQWFVFGAPWITPHSLYQNIDVMPAITIPAVWQRFVFYWLSPTTSLWINNAVLIPAIVGIYYGVKRRNPDMVAILMVVLFYSEYLLLIDTVGDCQYPPRYMLLLIPFVFSGIIWFYKSVRHIAWKIGAGLLIVVSIVSNSMATMHPTLNCSFEQNVWQEFVFSLFY